MSSWRKALIGFLPGACGPAKAGPIFSLGTPSPGASFLIKEDGQRLSTASIAARGSGPPHESRLPGSHRVGPAYRSSRSLAAGAEPLSEIGALPASVLVCKGPLNCPADSRQGSRAIGCGFASRAIQATVSASTLTRIAQGKRPDVDTLAALCVWSGLNPDDFIGRTASAAVQSEPLAQVMAQLRADPKLSPEGTKAIKTMIKTAYEQFRRG